MMKYFFALCSLLFLSVGATFAAYQNQGFSSYVENTDGTISFSCPQQCVILLDGDLDDILEISGLLQGSGDIGYGYLVNNEMLYSVSVAPVVPDQLYSWRLADSPTYRQLINQSPKLVVLFQGQISSTGMLIDQRNQGFGEKWTQFWTIENLAPFSINLRYGPYWGSAPWPKIGVYLLIFIALFYLFVSGKKRTLSSFIQLLIHVSVIVMVMGGIRILVDNIKITNQGLNSFVESNRYRFYDLDDYIDVTKTVRNQLDLDNISARKDKKCSIYIEAHQQWPFITHWDFVYLRPCSVVKTLPEADYSLYYKISTPIVIGAQTPIFTGDDFILFNTNN